MLASDILPSLHGVVVPSFYVALTMHLNCAPFTYDKYTLIRNADVIDISIERLAEINHDFKRYIRTLNSNGIQTTAELINQYYACKLKDYRGLGKKFYGLIKDFIDNQKQYRAKCEED